MAKLHRNLLHVRLIATVDGYYFGLATTNTQLDESSTDSAHAAFVLWYKILMVLALVKTNSESPFLPFTAAHFPIKTCVLC